LLLPRAHAPLLLLLLLLLVFDGPQQQLQPGGLRVLPQQLQQPPL
jgi:hypothetical protein